MLEVRETTKKSKGPMGLWREQPSTKMQVIEPPAGEGEGRKESAGATTRDKSPTRAYRALQREFDAFSVGDSQATQRSPSPSRRALQRMMIVRKVAAAARIQGGISAAASRREAREQLVHTGESDETPGAAPMPIPVPVPVLASVPCPYPCRHLYLYLFPYFDSCLFPSLATPTPTLPVHLTFNT